MPEGTPSSSLLIPGEDPPSSSGHRPPPQDDAILLALIDSESQTSPQDDYLHRCRSRSVNVTARQDSISWILKVHSHYHFRPLTALLAVNYFDRFLSAHFLPDRDDGWPFQLLSVACLSLAAKMEEPNVPLLVDLQTCDPKFVFDPTTVQRMELWVMANLGWRLHPVTPLDFLPFFASRIATHSSGSIVSSATDLILRTLRVIDFLGFTPSATAAAAVLTAAGGGTDLSGSLYERVNKEMVRSCHQLMEEYLVDTCRSPTGQTKEAAAEVEAAAGPPASPVGVLDAAACGSCDTRPDILSTSNGPDPSRPNKRPRSPAPDVQQP